MKVDRSPKPKTPGSGTRAHTGAAGSAARSVAGPIRASVRAKALAVVPWGDVAVEFQIEGGTPKKTDFLGLYKGERGPVTGCLGDTKPPTPRTYHG